MATKPTIMTETAILMLKLAFMLVLQLALL